MINDHHKTNKSTPKPQTIIAGVHPSDSNIEFYGAENPINKTPIVFWIQNGKTREWSLLPNTIYELCLNAYLSDAKAVAYLNKELTLEIENRKVEIYIYHLYGHLNHTPDVLAGVLQPSENFRQTKDCPSIDWDTKWITIHGNVLTTTEIKMIDLILKGFPDKVVASELGYSHSHYDTLKRNLFEKVGVQSKDQLVLHAVLEQLL